MIPAKANVLLLDDYELLRELGRRMLTSLGYHCVGAVATIEDALDCLDQEPVDILVADVGLRGEQLRPFKLYVEHTYPHIRILLISGTPEHTLVEQYKISGRHAFLLKPFSLDQLGAALDQLVAESRQEEA